MALRINDYGMVWKLKVAPTGSQFFRGNIKGIWIPQTLQTAPSVHHWIDDDHMMIAVSPKGSKGPSTGCQVTEVQKLVPLIATWM